MKLNFAHGAKFGALSAICFAMVITINKHVRGEDVTAELIVGWSAFALLFFGLIGTLTDKIGSDFGE